MDICFCFAQDLCLCLSLARARLLRQLLVEVGDVVEARSIFVGYSPLPKEDVALVPYFEVDHIVPNH